MIDLISAEPCDNDRILAMIDVTDDEGNTVRLAHRFPCDIIEWRAAEYDMDPGADAEELLDIIIWEPHIQIPEADRLYQTERSIAKQVLREAVRAAKGKSQERKNARRAAGTSPQARAALDLKESREKDTRKKILEMSVFDPEVISFKKEMVARVEREERERQATPAMDRKEMVKRQSEFFKKGATNG